jgi:prophage antirepressor-like protein
MNCLINISESTDRVVFDAKGAKKDQVKVVGTFEEPWFCGKDVCEILEYSDTKQALQNRVEDKCKKTLKEMGEALGVFAPSTSILGRNNLLNLSYNAGKAVYINEVGLYKLIMGSRAPLAKVFQDFVFEKVLPSIRKHGYFVVQQQAQQQAQLAIELEQKLRIKDYALEQKDLELEKKDQELEKKDQELEKKDRVLKNTEAHRRRMQEMLIDGAKLEKKQVIYIATSVEYASINRFKVGGAESPGNLKSRLSSYNTGRAAGDDFFFVFIERVHSYKDVEKRVQTILDRFIERKGKEMYFLHLTNLQHFVQYIIDHASEELEQLNAHLADMINNIDPEKLRPAKPVPVSLPAFLAKQKTEQKGRVVGRVSVGNNTPDASVEDTEQFRQQLRSLMEQINSTVPTIKQLFDALGVKEGRMRLRPVVIEFFSTERPDLKLKLR